MVRLNGGGASVREAPFALPNSSIADLAAYLWGEGAKILEQEELDPVLPTSRLLRNPLVS